MWKEKARDASKKVDEKDSERKNSERIST